MSLTPARACVAALASASLAVAAVVAAPTTGADAAPTATEIAGGHAADSAFAADALPTVQTDGRVDALDTHGNVAYAGGTFTHARPAGAARGENETPRRHVLALDLQTGALVDGFVADTDGNVTGIAVSPDGRTVYLAGAFAHVNGVHRNGFAAVDAATGTVLDLDARITGAVTAVTATDTTVYVGGYLDSVQDQPRQGLAAIDVATGRVTPMNTRVTGNYTVRDLHASPDGTRLIVGGQLKNATDATRSRTIQGFVLLDAVTGAIVETPMYEQVPAGGLGSGGVTGVDGDEHGFYVSGYGFGTGELESVASGTWDGELRYVADCHGDSTGVWSSGTEVHVTGHPYACNTLSGMPEDTPRQYNALHSFTNEARQTLIATPRIDYRSYAGLPAPQLTELLPGFAEGPTPGNATWAIDGSDDHMIVGGDFPKVNGTAQESLVRFPRRGITDHEEPPRWNELGITAESHQPGQVQILVTGTWDRDDNTLTYVLKRDGQVIDERTVVASEWARQDHGFVDTVEPGSTHDYSVEALDGDGNNAYKRVEDVTAMAGTPVAPGDSVAADYLSQVLHDGALYAWRPGQEGADQLTLAAGARRQQGLMTENAFYLNGGSEGYAYSPSTRTIPAPHVYSVEAWIRTPKLNVFGKTKGGPILGFGNQRMSLSGKHDRMLYVNNDGGLTLGTYPQSRYTLSTQKIVADDRWHHVVATQDGAGLRTIYIDGEVAAQERQPSGAETNEGYWRLGAEWVALWPNVDSWRVRHGMQGLVDTPAVYHRALTAEQVAHHYAIGTGQASTEVGVVPAPATGVTDAFERTVSGGWGTADEGGAWTTWGRGTVADGTGRLEMRPGSGAGARTATVNDDAVTQFTLGTDRVAQAPLYLTLAMRDGGGHRYEAKVAVRSGGTVTLGITAVTPQGTRYLGTKEVPGVVLGTGGTMQVRMRTVDDGRGGTTIDVAGWATGTEAPTTPLVSATDATPELQDAGTTSFEAYLGVASPTPLTATIDDWSTRPLAE